MDWTENLMIAAFFAVHDSNVRVTPVIYAVKDVTGGAPKQAQRPRFTRRGDALSPASHKPRIPARRSVFTVHRIPGKPFNPAELHRLKLRGKVSIIDTAKGVYEFAKQGATIELRAQLMKMR